MVADKTPLLLGPSSHKTSKNPVTFPARSWGHLTWNSESETPPGPLPWNRPARQICQGVGMELVELSMELSKRTSPKSPSTSASWSASNLPGSHHDFFSPKEDTEVPCGVDGFLGNIAGNLKKMGAKTMDSRKKQVVWNPLRQITNQTWRYELAFQFSSWALGSIWLGKTHDIKQSMSGSHKDEGNGNRNLANISWKSPPSWIIISQQ